MNKQKLNDKQRLFCDEYLKDRNGARAYRVAYPDCKSYNASRVGAKRLLNKDYINDYISKAVDSISKDKIAQAEEIMEFHTGVLRDEVVEKVYSTHGKILYERTPTIKEKQYSAELLAKLLGLYNPKMTVNVNENPFASLTKDQLIKLAGVDECE